MVNEKQEKIKIIELFAGFGGASFALKKAGIPFECVGYSEIDKYAIQCYNQNHSIKINEYLWNGHKNYGDITKINPEELPDFDLLTGGFPCQSFSIAGKGLGEQDTRGTLFNDIIRIAEVKKPKYMLLENVKGLTTKRHKETFEKILSELQRIGYNVYWKVLNTKEHGIPQNRERVFIVCFRKDIETNFQFPEKEELKIFLKDVLEDTIPKEWIDRYNELKKIWDESELDEDEYYEFLTLSNEIELRKVDEKYYLKEEQVVKLLPNQEISYCIDANYHKGTNIEGFINKKRRQLIQVADYRNDEGLRIRKNGLCPCLAARKHSETDLSTMLPFIISSLQIRKLTPKECFRLQGFINDEINLDGLSDTQKYKLAGNGWDINLVSKLFKNLINNE